MTPLQAIRGMNDILPNEIEYWHYLERTIHHVVSSYGYREIRFPVVEKTELFKRSIGEATDIVEKEMYTFEDRSGESLTLRPEGTAGCVRAGIEHGLLYNQIQRLWYYGPMFRYERPQKGRYRQFYQLGIEAFGMKGPQIDSEIILLSAQLWRELGLGGQVTLQLNSLSSVSARANYREKLVDYFTQRYERLDEDSQRRLKTNPLRILDSKNPEMASLIAEAPRLRDSWDEESRRSFDTLCRSLEHANLPYEVNPYLVRGLDYYNDTVFEWVSNQLGPQQGSICAGGRYDNLVEMLGGKSTPAVGFALGLERIVLLLKDLKNPEEFKHKVDAYVITVGDEAKEKSLQLIGKLRKDVPRAVIISDATDTSFKSQFKRADTSGARIALILGEEEVKAGYVTIKYLHEDRPQEKIDLNDEGFVKLLKILM